MLEKVAFKIQIMMQFIYHNVPYETDITNDRKYYATYAKCFRPCIEFHMFKSLKSV